MDSNQSSTFLSPHLRLFLSVDLVGSTALKQHADTRLDDAPLPSGDLNTFDSRWFSVLSTFYQAIERYFSEEWLRACSVDETSPATVAPELWKANGDELLFSKQLQTAEDAYICTCSWMSAMRRYRTQLKEEHPQLDIKCAIWSAGFPFRNSEIVFRPTFGPEQTQLAESTVEQFLLLESWYADTGDRPQLRMDFIGPSIDTGFRIADHATPRRITLSVEAAFLLACVARDRSDDQGLTFGYDGRRELKGVIGGKPYPVFWIDMLADDPVLKIEDKFSGISKPTADQVFDFCDKFIFENHKQILRPFIPGCSKQQLCAPPEHYNEFIKQLNDVWIQQKAKHLAENSGLEGEDGPDTLANEEKLSDHEAIDLVKRLIPPASPEPPD